MNFLYSVFLIISVIFSSISGLLTRAEQTETVTAEPSVAAVKLDDGDESDADLLAGQTELDAGGTDWADMEYVHYDPSAFYAETEQLSLLAHTEKADAIIEQYDRIYSEFLYIDTLYSIAYIHYCCDVTDSYWSAEYLYCGTLWSETSDALCSACRLVMDSAAADVFAAHVGESAAEAYRAYEAMTEEQTELSDRELALVNEYYEAVNALDAACSYQGKTWTWDDLNGFRGDSLYYQDYEGYLEVYYGLQKAENDVLGPIYAELVSIRAQMAESMGYASYADYAYECVYGRDYSTEDAQTLCDAVKELAAEYYDKIYYSDLWYEADSVEPTMGGEELVAALGQIVGAIDADTQSALSLTAVWQYMTEHNLYSIDAGGNRISGAYTITLSGYDCPFIYADMANNCYDVLDIVHEFGHFTNDLTGEAPNPLADVGSYDLFEIHSNGLEVLATAYYDDIFSYGADVARFLTLAEQLDGVISGCINDEFQRRVYARPDMTLEEMNALYAEICAEYGEYEPMGVDYAWMYVSHNFESPLYYISYAASSLAALQLWDMAQTDYQLAADAYFAVMSENAYDSGYREVLSRCGLRLFTEEGACADICRPVLTYLEELDAAR